MLDTAQTKTQQIDEYLCEIRESQSSDPNQTPYYSYWLWMYYWLIFWFDYPLILLFETTNLMLSIYGILKSKYKSYINKQKHVVEFPLQTAEPEKKTAAFISIIVSCYNESSNIEQLLLYIEKHCVDKENTEIILVDGGSSDNWWTKLPKHNVKLATLMTIKIKSIKFAQHKKSGRGICQSIGVKHCDKKTEILLFLHADTIVCNKYDEIIRNNLNCNIVCGAFRFGLDCNGMIYPMPGFKAVQFRIDLDTYLCWLPFGDQCLFMTLNMYRKLDGMPNQCIMEDFEFMIKARKYAFENNMEIFIAKEKVYTSPRKYYKSGRIWKNTLINQYVIYLYQHLNYSPQQVYKVYYGKSLPNY